MEYFGVFQGLLGPFVLISFRSYGGILMISDRSLLARAIIAAQRLDHCLAALSIRPRPPSVTCCLH